MTLGRQLFIGLSLLFAFLVFGIEAIFVQNARHYLQQQLEAHAQETATSLALSLGQGMQVPDPVLARTLINPVFDRGNFASIKLMGMDGRPLIARDLGNVPDEAPALFMRLLPLNAPTGEALVSSGWRQLGRVLVVVHPHIASNQLWHTALETLAWLVALYVCALFATRRYLRGILRPLEAIEQAALAFGRGEFGEVHLDTSAPELQRVGMAMNDLSEKLRIAITPESTQADRLPQQAFQAPLTEVLNHRSADPARAAPAFRRHQNRFRRFAFVSMTGIKAINRSLGAAKGGELLQQCCGGVLRPLFARFARI